MTSPYYLILESSWKIKKITFLKTKMFSKDYILNLDKIFLLQSLLNVTENIRQVLYERKIGCVIFVDLQKTFGTVDNDIFLVKWDQYVVSGITNSRYKSYFSERKQRLYNWYCLLSSFNLHAVYLKDLYLVPAIYLKLYFGFFQTIRLSIFVDYIALLRIEVFYTYHFF